MLTCKEAERMVIPYIENQLNESELEAFVNHVRHCPDCKEELEIYYTVSLGLKQLDSSSDIYDMNGALEESLDTSSLIIRAVRLRKIISYSVSTLLTVGVLITLLLQIRIWFQTGFLL